METKDLQNFKEKLLAQKKNLEEELEVIGRHNPSNPADWEAVPGKRTNPHPADETETADRIEEYEENTAILKQLEIELKGVNDALDKIEKGTYGICEVSGQEIEQERLEAYPAARTCIKHTKK